MSSAAKRQSVISVRDLCVDFSAGPIAQLLGATAVHAVKKVSLEVREGMTFGIVGESGSGKSTTARAIIGLEETTSGEILYLGESMRRPNAQRRRSIARDIQMVFQDPASALNPKLKIGQLIAERVRIHRPDEWPDRHEIVRNALAEVGLPHEHTDRFPHQLSGGQQQRVVIALGLISRPRVLICDEAVSGLDVSSQAQVLNLLNELKESRGLSLIFITHDMGVARYISDEVAVMRKGEVVEQGPVEQIFSAPRTEYTRSLMDAVPNLPRTYSFD